MQKIILTVVFYISALHVAMAEDYVYVFPDGRIQWGPNVRAKKVKLSDIPEKQRQELLRQRSNTPTTRERLIEYSKKFTPQLAASPATRVRVLLACDTQAEGGIAAGVTVDMKRMQQYFEDAFPNRPHDCSIDTISGPALSADAMLRFYQTLDSIATETLVCYYSGHGAQTPLGHALSISDGTVLYRQQLLKEMQARRVRFRWCARLQEFSSPMIGRSLGVGID
jgi:hypothetical protein